MSDPRRASPQQRGVEYVRLPNGQMKPAAPLESVVTTAELARRHPRPADYEAENRALVSLMHELSNPSGNVLQKLADTVLELCEAQSAGISILEEDENGRKIFRWHATAGKWSKFLGGTMPREISPCGAVLDRNIPLLLSHPERHFPFPPEVVPPINEVLLVPFHVADEAVGTIWVIAHDDARKFDREDERLITSLGKFASVAHQTKRSGHALEVELTERKHAETAGRDTESRYRVLFDAVSVALFVCDPTGVITEYNRRAAELWGREPRCGVEKHCGSTRLILPDGSPLPHEQSPIVEVLRTGTPARNVEVFIERPDGSRIPVLVNFVALKAANGEVTGAVTSFIDLTELKRTEKELADELAGTLRLQEISAQLIHEGGGRAFYDKILDVAVAVMRSDAGSIQMFDPRRGELRLLTHQGFHAAAAASWEWVRVDSGTSCGAALTSGQRVIVPDIEKAEFIAGTPSLEGYRRCGIRAVQSTPLISRSGRILGMISTHWREPHQPSERDLRLLDVLARQVADLIERSQVEETLRDSEQNFRRMIDALPVAIYTTDSEGRITHYNPAAVELSGRVPELGSDRWCVSWKLFRPDGTPLPIDECPMAAALKGLPVEPEQEIIAERPNGTRVRFTAFPTALRDAAGKIVGGINMLMDVTERKKAGEFQAYLAAIVDSSDDAIVSKNLDGVITSWNQSAERLFGYSAAEAVGQHITLIVPPDRLHEEAMILRDLRAGNRIDHFETVRVRKDGTRVDVSLTISPVRDSAGRVIGASKIARDISERKRTEGLLRVSEDKYRNLVGNLEEKVDARTRELVERNAEVIQQAEQLRALSHRLMQIQDDERRRIARDLHDSAGQYLSALSMTLQAARQTTKNLPPKLAQKLDEASEITYRCSSEIRTLSHLLHPPLIEELGLAAAISWYVEGFAKRGEVQINLQMPPKLKRVGDDIELALFRVLQECLTNIHRHSGSKTATVRVEVDDHRAILEVIDQGTGIPKSTLDLRKAGPRRTGVGISGMRERLKDLGGTLEIDSSEQGTTVRAEIPLRMNAAAEADASFAVNADDAANTTAADAAKAITAADKAAAADADTAAAAGTAN
ncbi:MAG: PAS domain S-box protein [Candidatus Acidiferrales bacterium]